MGTVWLSAMWHAIPTFLLIALGACYAIVKWQNHPRLSAVVLVALGLMASIPIASGLLWGLGQATHQYLFTAFIKYVGPILSAVEKALLIFAAFFGYYEGRRATNEQIRSMIAQ
jgi:hypothetical protein